MDAILGTFTTSIYCLLKKFEGADNHRVFGKSKITFMITKPEVGLDRLILGLPWQKEVKLFLRMEDEIKASARLHYEGGARRCKLQLKHTGNIWMESQEKIDKVDTHAIFGLSSVFLEDNISLKLNKLDGINLPEYINLKNDYRGIVASQLF